MAVLSLTAGQLLARARQMSEPAYRAAVDELPGELRRIVGYYAGWWEAYSPRYGMADYLSETPDLRFPHP